MFLSPNKKSGVLRKCVNPRDFPLWIQVLSVQLGSITLEILNGFFTLHFLF